MPLSQDHQTTVQHIARHLAQSRRILFITGAGVSADSGLPTYRGIGGLYHDTLTEEALPIEDALSGEMMIRRPEVTWKYIAEIERACRGARHNTAHDIIARAEQRFDAWVLTQNVDGLHRMAGSRNLIEIHGDIHRLECRGCGLQRKVVDYSTLAIPPRCPDCTDMLRPAVVLFGEVLPEATVALLYKQLEQGFDMVFTIGTTSIFPYISSPVAQAHRQGIPTVEINPGETVLSPLVDHRLPLGAAASLEAIWQSLEAID